MFSSRPKPIRFDTPEKEKPRRMELFPQYSTPLPEFEGETIDMHTMKPVRPREMSDGTPRTVAMSPELHASFTDLVKSHSDSSKVIPLHVQTDETEEEMEAYIPERPEDFTPMRSPNPRSPYLSKLGMESSRRHLTKESKAPGPMFEMPRARDLKIPNSWKKWRLYFLLFLFLGLLLGIILLPLWASGKLNNNNTTETTPSSSLSASTANNGGGIDTGSLNGTTSWFTPGGKDAKQPDFLGNSEPPSIAPITTATPTTAPPLILQPTAPINAPSSNKINTPVPTLNDGSHRLIPILSPHVPMDTLLDPNSFAGEALIWLVDKDLQLEGVNSERRIIQRFALTVLDVALHHPKPRAWSSRNMHECRWPGVTCDGQRWVTGINWAEQNLQGILPSELGLLTQLTSVDVAQNQLKGTLESLYTLESLEHAILFENQLTGPALTEQVQKLGNLTKLMIGHNQLTGTIPSGVRMRPLRWLVLHHNQLTGTLPSDWNLLNAFLLDLSYNKLMGTIPDNFADEVIPNIRHLHLDHNQLSGSIPTGFRTLGKGRARQLYLNDNRFSGVFPQQWETIKHLNNIDLSNNDFRNQLDDMCMMSVFEYGELVELRADCEICNCFRLCRTCDDNIDFEYVYDDDDWEFDDDWVE